MRSLFVWKAGKRNLTIKFPHTHARAHTSSELLILPRETRLMGAAFLRWLTPRWQAHYSRVSGDLGVKVISPNSLQLSVPLTSLPEQHGRQALFKSRIPQGAALVPCLVTRFLSDWETPGRLTESSFSVQQQCPRWFLWMLRHLKRSSSWNKERVTPFYSCCVDSASLKCVSRI